VICQAVFEINLCILFRPPYFVVQPDPPPQAREKIKKVAELRKFFLHFRIPFAIINKLFIWNYYKRGGAASNGKV
jgi:hypothetical protein